VPLKDVNFAGADLPGTGQKKASAAACCQACKSVLKCKAWTFIVKLPGNPKFDGTCWLKGDIPVAVPTTGMVSGLP